jgi:glycosyltransferase involved in cell wall biosynthesis
MSVDGRPLRVVQVTRYAQGGGAERIAASLHEGLRRRGHRSWIATARTSDDPSILTIPPPPTEPAGAVARSLLRAADRLGTPRKRGVLVRTLRRGLRFAASPRKTLDNRRGRESFDYPGTAAIPDLPPERPDLVHCHNLHGGFFDLRQLAPMSHRLPLVITLHDEWTFTGHCAYALYGERWRSGCVSCPDLTIYPAIPHDGTRANLRAKREIYRRSRLYITTPSKWLLDRAQHSVIAEGAAAWRLIPNGVDSSIFSPADAHAARAHLGLPPEPFILLFAANGARRSPFKDFPTVSKAVVEAAARVSSRPVLCLALGDTGPPESFPNGELRFVPYIRDLNEIAAYYQAADVYLHAARAENLPTTILEALATGLPVVATAVGGIPEEVRSLAGAPGGWSGVTHPREEATGVLVNPADAAGMGAATAAILADDELRAALSANARTDAALRFDLDLQLDTTIAWYREIIADWGRRTERA